MIGKGQSEPLSTSGPQSGGITSLTFVKTTKRRASVGLEVSKPPVSSLFLPFFWGSCYHPWQVSLQEQTCLLLSSDSCKFLHDRSDYKHGWQIERELEEGRYGANGEPPLGTGLWKHFASFVLLSDVLFISQTMRTMKWAATRKIFLSSVSFVESPLRTPLLQSKCYIKPWPVWIANAVLTTAQIHTMTL